MHFSWLNDITSPSYDSSNVPYNAIQLSSSNNVILVLVNCSTIDLKLFKCLATKFFFRHLHAIYFFNFRTYLLQTCLVSNTPQKPSQISFNVLKSLTKMNCDPLNAREYWS
jgi:hypothetical protein